MLYLLPTISLSLSGTMARGAVMRTTYPVMEVASPPGLKLDLVEPVFPQVCEYAGITLSRYVLEMARANPEKVRTRNKSMIEFDSTDQIPCTVVRSPISTSSSPS